MGLLQDAREQPAVDLTPPSNQVWHYTDAGALLSICQNGRLWASHSAGLNDSGEVAYGWGVMCEAYECMREDLERDAPEDLIGLIEGVLGTGSVGDHYVLSASADGEVLNQWQHYGRNGYALALSAAQPLAVSAIEFLGAEPAQALMGTWSSVLYDRGQQLLHAAQTLLDFMTDAGDFINPHEYLGDPEEGDPPLWWFATQHLSAEVGLYKHSAFRAERECRMVFTDDYDVSVRPTTRVRQGQFLQYLDVGMPQYQGRYGARRGLLPGSALPLLRLPLQEIRCGPTPAPLREGRLASMRRMLSSAGYGVYDPESWRLLGDSAPEGVKVSASDLPYVP